MTFFLDHLNDIAVYEHAQHIQLAPVQFVKAMKSATPCSFPITPNEPLRRLEQFRRCMLAIKVSMSFHWRDKLRRSI